ncbi:MAG: hypothetical protein Q6353_017100, partial [Candidatus Sigynarchaeum springense]
GIKWSPATTDEEFELGGGNKIVVKTKLAYAYKNGLPCDTVAKTGGTKPALAAGDKITGMVGGKTISAVVRAVIGDVVDLQYTTKKARFPTGKPVAIATESGDWTGTITAGLSVAQYNLARALDASGIDYKTYRRDANGNPMWNAPGTTPSQRLEWMLECAMNNLFEKDATTVTFSIGFLVGGPHQALVDAAGLVPRHIRQFYP